MGQYKGPKTPEERAEVARKAFAGFKDARSTARVAATPSDHPADEPEDFMPKPGWEPKLGPGGGNAHSPLAEAERRRRIAHKSVGNQKARKWNDAERHAVTDEICAEMAKGRSLKKMLGPDRQSHLPTMDTFMRWIFKDGDEYVLNAYQLARQIRAEGYADETIDLADESQSVSEKDTAGVNSYKLRVETRQWMAAHILPKIYGDKTEGESGLQVHIHTNLGGADDERDTGEYVVEIPAKGGDGG